MKKFFELVLFFVMTMSQAFSLGDIAFQEMEKYLKQKGTGGSYTFAKYEKMIELFSSIYQQVDSQDKDLMEPEENLKQQRIRNCENLLPYILCRKIVADKRSDEISESDHKMMKLFFDYGLRYLEEKKQHHDENERAYAFVVAKNLIYNVFAGSYKGRSMTATEIVEFPFKKMQAEIKFQPLRQRLKRLTLQEAQKEAQFLVDPQSYRPQKLLKAEDLVGRDHIEIGNLDVREDHHIWHSESYIQSHPHMWEDFVSMIHGIIQQQIRKEFANENLQYPLEEARRIVFFDKHKDYTGAHPKVRVKDAYGLKWKFKWGNEFFAEQLANILYMSLGGKYQDFNFSHTTENPVVMVFPADNHSTSQDPCDNVYNFKQLKQCIDKHSKRYHNLDRYVYPFGTGVISAGNLDWVLQFVPQEIKDKHKNSQELLGRSYAVFHQISLELRDKRILKRSGPAPHSTMGNESDRAMRGMILFHMWTDNFDIKDGNGEGVLMPTPEGPQQLIQAPTDLGAAFRGSIMHGAGPNHYAIKKWLYPSFSGRHLVYPRMMVFFPKSGHQATFADTYWMAKKIASLPYSLIKKAIASVHLPDFYQEVLLYRIIKRRNHIAKIYGLVDRLDVTDNRLRVPNFTIDLSSDKENERQFSQRYAIPLYLIQQAKARAKLTQRSWQDVVVRRGVMKKCSESFVIQLLEEYAYPSGLSRNLSKNWENPGKCRFRK